MITLGARPAGADDAMAFIDFIRNWKEIEKAITNFDKLRDELKVAVDKLKVDRAELAKGQEAFNAEKAVFNEYASKTSAEIAAAKTAVVSKEMAVAEKLEKLAAAEKAVEEATKVIAEKEKSLNAVAGDAEKLVAAANKQMEQARAMQADYTQRIENLKKVMG